MFTGKRRFGDRWDGELIRKLDAMHFIMPLIYPNRCDNEAYISERVELAPARAYLARMNQDEHEFPYTPFHLIVAALIKTITLRPKMNRFITSKNMYQRRDVSASFVVKKIFSDDGAEGLALLHATPEDTMRSLHEKLRKQVTGCRSEKNDPSSDAMDMFNRLPRFVSKAAVWTIAKLEKHGLCPRSLIATDPYYSSVILSNIGSLKLKSGYHHLTNWGTTSIFCLVGAIKQTPVFDADGAAHMAETVDLGLTIDERIADGYYYSKTVRLFKYLLTHPEELDKPMNQEVDYE